MIEDKLEGHPEDKAFSITVNGPEIGQPADHTMHFAGEYPCDDQGSPIEALRNNSDRQELAEGLWVDHYFSAKPVEGNYRDYYHKFTHYAQVLGRCARRIDPGATGRTEQLVQRRRSHRYFIFDAPIFDCRKQSTFGKPASTHSKIRCLVLQKRQLTEPSTYEHVESGRADSVRINSGALEILRKLRLHVSLVRGWYLFGTFPGILPEIQAIRCDQQEVIANTPDAMRKQIAPQLDRPVTRRSELALDLGNRRDLSAPIKDSYVREHFSKPINAKRVQWCVQSLLCQP